MRITPGLAIVGALLAAPPGAAQAQSPGFLATVPGGSVTAPDLLPGSGVPARNPPPIAGPIQGRGTQPFPTSIQGRWSASATCARGTTQLVLTNDTMELIGRGGRMYHAGIAHVQDGTDRGVLVTSAPNVNQMGSAGALLGDTYLFRYDSSNRITPIAIVRATARRDRVSGSWPAFFRCR